MRRLEAIGYYAELSGRIRGEGGAHWPSAKVVETDLRDELRAECNRCGEQWTLDITCVSDRGAADLLLEVIGSTPCRGRPLYRPIPGTPWFTYSI